MLTELPAVASAAKPEVRPRVYMLLPLVPPAKESVPSDSSPAPRKEGRDEKVMPVVVGVTGVPVPSTQESFCIHEMPNWPAALALKMALLGGVAVSWSVTDWMVQRPAPNWLSKELL